MKKQWVISMKEPQSSKVIYWELRNNFPLSPDVTGVLLISTSRLYQISNDFLQVSNAALPAFTYTEDNHSKPILTHTSSFQCWFTVTVLCPFLRKGVKKCMLTHSWEHLSKEDPMAHYEVLLSDHLHQFAWTVLVYILCPCIILNSSPSHSPMSQVKWHSTWSPYHPHTAHTMLGLELEINP